MRILSLVKVPQASLGNSSPAFSAAPSLSLLNASQSSKKAAAYTSPMCQ